jgi:2-hydroxy-3-keto-5-methylthiopentenyl-1-phosphate phosphatase
VSDLSAARETDLLFAKKGHGMSSSSKANSFCTNQRLDLIKYCARENVPFTVFEDWSSILEQVQDIVDGKVTVDQAAREGYEQYKSGAVALNGHAK